MLPSADLNAREFRLWRAWTNASENVAARVARDVMDASGLSAADFDILERLVALGGGNLRQRELATALGWDKSRVSHQLTRMHDRKLLVRTKTAEDGSRITISRAGREALKRALPFHARAVRRHLLERLTPEQAEALAALADDPKT